MVLRLPLFLVAVVLAACQPGYMLELHVVNDADRGVVVEILGPEGEQALSQPVGAGRSMTIAAERPGPGVWAVAVDGKIVTRGDEWPSDNPTIDLSLSITPGGRVDVIDS